MTRTRKLSGVFMIKGTHGLTRMVHTQDLRKRWSEWQAASPFPLHIVGMITKSSTAKNITQAFTMLQDKSSNSWTPQFALQALKAAFASRHASGDWYDLDDQTLASLPLEHPSATNKLTVQAAIDRLEVEESHKKALCNRPNISLPHAPSVWAAVRYAQEQVAKKHVSGWVAILLATDQHLVKWLIKHGRKDISVVLRFHQEYEALIAALSQTAVYAFDPLSDTCAWMVLQGESTFAKIATTPALLDDYQDHEYETYFAYDALNKLVTRGALAGMEYIGSVESHLDKGGHVEDFAGWSANRLALHFGGGSQ